MNVTSIIKQTYGKQIYILKDFEKNKLKEESVQSKAVKSYSELNFSSYNSIIKNLRCFMYTN